jgi:four helix bundle protein
MTEGERKTAEMRERTKHFALRVVRLVQALPREETARVVGRQLLRSGTSVGANYRAVCRARSPAEFISKLGIVLEEADECCFWLELLIESELMKADRVQPLLDEANQLVAIIAASRRTAQKRNS